jgi:hypothetical protein
MPACALPADHHLRLRCDGYRCLSSHRRRFWLGPGVTCPAGRHLRCRCCATCCPLVPTRARATNQQSRKTAHESSMSRSSSRRNRNRMRERLFLARSTSPAQAWSLRRCDRARCRTQTTNPLPAGRKRPWDSYRQVREIKDSSSLPSAPRAPARPRLASESSMNDAGKLSHGAFMFRLAWSKQSLLRPGPS